MINMYEFLKFLNTLNLEELEAISLHVYRLKSKINDAEEKKLNRILIQINEELNNDAGRKIETI